MALIQLVHGGQEDQNRINRRTSQLYEIQEENRNRAGWNKTLIFPMVRHADIVRHMFASIKLKKAPEGYRWKRLLPLHMIKSMKIIIGGDTIWETSSEVLLMRYNIDGFRTTPQWSNIPIDPEPETLFDFSEGERTRRSQKPLELFFEPLDYTSNLRQTQYNIPLVRLAFHTVKIEVVINSLENCIEPIGDRIPLPIDQDTLFEDFLFRADYIYLDTNERRELCHNIQYDIPTSHFEYCSEVFPTQENGRIVQAHINANLVCTNAYIWITDEQNQELPSTVVQELSVYLNGQLRECLTGFQSRFGLRDAMPHPVVSNNRSQNVYYISYTPGVREANPLEQGVNLSRIDDYRIDFRFAEYAPPRVRIHMIHRVDNIMQYRSGMGGLRWIGGHHHLSDRPFRSPIQQPPPQLTFEQTDQAIDISEEKKQCIIQYTDFTEGDLVYECLSCHVIIGADAMDRWLSTRLHKKCVHCQSIFNPQTFRKGKAHLLNPQIPPAVPPDPQESNQPQGMFQRFVHYFQRPVS